MHTLNEDDDDEDDEDDDDDDDDDDNDDGDDDGEGAGRVVANSSGSAVAQEQSRSAGLVRASASVGSVHGRERTLSAAHQQRKAAATAPVTGPIMGGAVGASVSEGDLDLHVGSHEDIPVHNSIATSGWLWKVCC